MSELRVEDHPDLPRPGDVVAERYEIRSRIGVGGFAVVYEANDARTRQTVALKVLLPSVSNDPVLAARFEREVRTVAGLQHHNTIRVFDAGRTPGGSLFMVMERLRGESLDVRLRREGPLPAELVRRIAIQVLRALSEAHAVGIVHRDLKPSNLFLARMPGEADYVKVLDFGIAKAVGAADQKLTATGALLCSPQYVAPERIIDGRAVPASDLYSLGVLMVELLEGKPPVARATSLATMAEHARMDVPVPLKHSTRSGELGKVLSRATAKPLDQRYSTAAEMLADLDAPMAALTSGHRRTVPDPPLQPTPEPVWVQPAPPQPVQPAQPHAEPSGSSVAIGTSEALRRPTPPVPARRTASRPPTRHATYRRIAGWTALAIGIALAVLGISRLSGDRGQSSSDTGGVEDPAPDDPDPAALPDPRPEPVEPAVSAPTGAAAAPKEAGATCDVDDDCGALAYCSRGACVDSADAAAETIRAHHAAYVSGDREHYFADFAPVLECFHRAADYDREDIVRSRGPAFDHATRTYTVENIHGTPVTRDRVVVTEWHTFGGTSGTRGWVLERRGGRWLIVAESSRTTAACFPYPEYLDPAARGG